MSITIVHKNSGKKYKKTEEEVERIKNSAIGKNYTYEKPAPKPAEATDAGTNTKLKTEKPADQNAASGSNATTK